MTSDQIQGIALWSDLDGRLLYALRDELGVIGSMEPGDAIRALFDPMSRRKFDRMIETVGRDQAVYDWQLDLLAGDRLRSIHLAAGRNGDRILIIGSDDSGLTDSLYQELVRMSGDQATALRAALKELDAREQKRRAPEQAFPDAPDLEAFTRMNNELVRVQRELAKRNRALERLNDEKSVFVGMAAHDLRQPLSAVIGMAELLRLGTSSQLSPQQQKLVEVIQRAGQSMLQLVNDLLDVSLIESGKLELRYARVSVRALIDDVVSAYSAHAADKRIEVSSAFEPDLPETVWLDADRMGQVLANLLSNAIKYSHADTEIHISVACADDLLSIAVADRGQGIPASELERLFKPFSRTSVRTTANETSTGLGLMISERVVREHGGRIAVDSVVGEGSTFRVMLPWRAPSAD